MKTTQIEEYIEKAKENAKKSIAILLTVTTIGTGTICLTHCDSRQQTNANETDTITSITEILTNNTTETETNIATNQTREKTEEEKKLQALLIEECPKFKNGIYGMHIIVLQDGDKIRGYRFQFLYSDEKGNLAPVQDLPPIPISDEEFIEIQDKLVQKFTRSEFNTHLIELNNLTDEEIDFICSKSYMLYINQPGFEIGE